MLKSNSYQDFVTLISSIPFTLLFVSSQIYGLPLPPSLPSCPLFPRHHIISFHTHTIPHTKGFPSGSAGEESTCNVGVLSSIPGLGRSPGEGKGLPTPVFWPREFHGLYSPWGCKESDMTERISLSLSHTMQYASVKKKEMKRECFLT